MEHLQWAHRARPGARPHNSLAGRVKTMTASALASGATSAFAAGGQEALVEFLLNNSFELMEEQHAGRNPAREECTPPKPKSELTRQETIIYQPIRMEQEYQCEGCGSYNLRDEPFSCMRTCADCALCWYYLTDTAAQCLDYDDVIRAKEQVGTNFRGDLAWIHRRSRDSRSRRGSSSPRSSSSSALTCALPPPRDTFSKALRGTRTRIPLVALVDMNLALRARASGGGGFPKRRPVPPRTWPPA